MEGVQAVASRRLGHGVRADVDARGPNPRTLGRGAREAVAAADLEQRRGGRTVARAQPLDQPLALALAISRLGVVSVVARPLRVAAVKIAAAGVAGRQRRMARSFRSAPWPQSSQRPYTRSRPAAALAGTGARERRCARKRRTPAAG